MQGKSFTCVLHCFVFHLKDYGIERQESCSVRSTNCDFVKAFGRAEPRFFCLSRGEHNLYPASRGGSQSRSLQSSPRPWPCFWAEVSPASASFPNVPVNSSAGQSLPQTSPHCLCITQSSPGRESLCNPGWLRVSYVDQLASNPRRSTCLCLPRAGTKGVCHHIQQSFLRQTGGGF